MGDVPRKPKPRPLAMVIADEVGFRDSIKVLTFIISWGSFIESEGRPPETVDELADWYRMSRAKAFKEQKLFRLALPGEETPTRLWALARTKVDVKSAAAPVILGGLSLS